MLHALAALAILLPGAAAHAPVQASIAQVTAVVFDAATGAWRKVDPAKDFLNEETSLGLVVTFGDPYIEGGHLVVRIFSVADDIAHTKTPLGRARRIAIHPVYGPGAPTSHSQFVFLKDGELCDHLWVTVSMDGAPTGTRSVDLPFACGD